MNSTITTIIDDITEGLLGNMMHHKSEAESEPDFDDLEEFIKEQTGTDTACLDLKWEHILDIVTVYLDEEITVEPSNLKGKIESLANSALHDQAVSQALDVLKEINQVTELHDLEIGQIQEGPPSLGEFSHAHETEITSDVTIYHYRNIDGGCHYDVWYFTFDLLKCHITQTVP